MWQQHAVTSAEMPFPGPALGVTHFQQNVGILECPRRKMAKLVRFCRPSQVEKFWFVCLSFGPVEMCPWPLYAMLEITKVCYETSDSFQITPCPRTLDPPHSAPPFPHFPQHLSPSDILCNFFIYYVYYCVSSASLWPSRRRGSLLPLFRDGSQYSVCVCIYANILFLYLCSLYIEYIYICTYVHIYTYTYMYTVQMIV